MPLFKRSNSSNSAFTITTASISTPSTLSPHSSTRRKSRQLSVYNSPPSVAERDTSLYFSTSLPIDHSDLLDRAILFSATRVRRFDQEGKSENRLCGQHRSFSASYTNSFHSSLSLSLEEEDSAVFHTPLEVEVEVDDLDLDNFPLPPPPTKRGLVRFHSTEALVTCGAVEQYPGPRDISHFKSNQQQYQFQRQYQPLRRRPGQRRKQKRSISSGEVLEGQKKERNTFRNRIMSMSEIWGKDEMAQPPVPPRSTLRTMSTSNPASPSPMSPASPRSPPPITERYSSLYKITPDQPLPDLPGLTDSSSDETESVPRNSASLPMKTNTTSGSGIFGRRKITDKDPLRVRDGVPRRESASGVYTPTTFPGAQGPRPSHFPSHVYTPPGFQLYNGSGSGPSRSSSVSSDGSSSQLDTPATPLSPSTRFSGIAGKTFTSIKRFSSSIPSMTPRTPPTPGSAKESYFPSMTPIPTHARSTSWDVNGVGIAPKAKYGEPYSVAPTYFGAGKAQGLGIGLEEPEGRIESSPTPMDDTPSKPKGKRKPVPRVAEVEEVTGEMEKLEVGGLPTPEAKVYRLEVDAV